MYIMVEPTTQFSGYRINKETYVYNDVNSQLGENAEFIITLPIGGYSQ